MNIIKNKELKAKIILGIAVLAAVVGIIMVAKGNPLGFLPLLAAIAVGNLP
jgi:hypothetical protein